jgi:hypothetical protein
VPNAPADSPVPGQPTGATREFVRDLQERAFGELARALGLGDDPHAAHARVTRPIMPAEYADPAKLRETMGSADIPEEEWERFAAQASATYARYAGAKLRTPFEDPNGYATMLMTYEGVIDALQANGVTLAPVPVVATLPSGRIDAQVSIEPTTGIPVIFFERGLLQYIGDFALIVGWAMPPISMEQMQDESQFEKLLGQYMISGEADRYYSSLVEAYAVEGTPIATARPIADPRHNMPLAITVGARMRAFVMAHEVGHILLAHLDRPASREHEFEADEAGIKIVNQVSGFGGWGVRFWSCDLVFSALYSLYRAIGILEFGKRRLQWTSRSHPKPHDRRDRLRELWSIRGLDRTSVTAARVLCGISDVILERLDELATPVLLQAHANGKRPSPMWRELLEDTFSAFD